MFRNHFGSYSYYDNITGITYNLDNTNNNAHEEKKPAPKMTEKKLPLLKITESVLISNIFPFLTLADQTKLTFANRYTSTLFKTDHGTSKLMWVVAKYHLSYEKHKMAKLKSQYSLHTNIITDPILVEAKFLLNANPELGLKKTRIKDYSNRIHLQSPFQNAFWSGNWIMYNLIFDYIKLTNNGVRRAYEQIKELFDKSESYDLDLLPVLVNKTVNEITPRFHRILLKNCKSDMPKQIPFDTLLINVKPDLVEIYTKGNTHYIPLWKREEFKVSRLSTRDALLKRIIPFFKNQPSEEILRESDINTFDKLLCIINEEIKLLRREEKLVLKASPLQYSPTLVKEIHESGKESFHVWGNVNGMWQITTLKPTKATLFASLPFPSLDKAQTLDHSEITKDMYYALKQAHTLESYELMDFVNATQRCIDEDLLIIGKDAQDRRNSYCTQTVGLAQFRFAGWIAHAWSGIHGWSTDKDRRLLSLEKALTYYHDHYSTTDFFANGLGSRYSYREGLLRSPYNRDKGAPMIPVIHHQETLETMRSLNLKISTERSQFLTRLSKLLNEDPNNTASFDNYRMRITFK